MPTGRFAPSPTGPLHLGNLRTALVAWLFARSAGSPFLVRVEDLDPVASREQWIEQHLADLAAIGLDWDGVVVRQSERRSAHVAAVERLRDDGLLYPCWCTRREIAEAAQAAHGPLPEGAYPGTCRGRPALGRGDRAPALRVRAGGVTVGFADEIHGRVEAIIDDFVVQKGDGTPAYNLAVVVDDAWQGVEQVVRGDDLLLGTPRQVWLAGVLGVPVPSYAHVPLVLNAAGQRLAKRDGAVTVADLGPAETRRLLDESLGDGGTTPATFNPALLPGDPWFVR